MFNAAEFTETFLKKMKSGYYKKDKQKNVGPILDDEYISEEMKKVDAILDSGIIQEVLMGVGHE